MRRQLIDLVLNANSIGGYERFFDFASVTNRPQCFYSNAIEGKLAEAGAWDEAKLALFSALADTLLRGRLDAKQIARLKEGRPVKGDCESLGVAIHSGTTRSIQRALRVAQERLRRWTGRQYPTLLTTDFEYPGVLTAIDEVWAGPVFFARLRDRLKSSSDSIVKHLRAAVAFVRPDLIYVSHVERYTGFALPWTFFSEVAGSGDAPPIVIIDGAQAPGNLDSALPLTNDTGPHLYATSGHKFLCGLPTLGLLVALRKDVLSADEHFRMDLEDKAVSYSLEVGARGTGSIESMASLARGLSSVLARTPNREVTEALIVGLSESQWNVVVHAEPNRGGLFRVSTNDERTALRVARLSSRRAARVGYAFSPPLRERDAFLARGLTDATWRVYVDVNERGECSINKEWSEDLPAMVEQPSVPQPTDDAASYRISVHPRLHTRDDVDRLCEFLKEPRSWKDRDLTLAEKELQARIRAKRSTWANIVGLGISLLHRDRFPVEGSFGASYHVTSEELLRLYHQDARRDRAWGEGGVTNSHYALKGLRPYTPVSDVKVFEKALCDHWSRRAATTDFGLLGLRSASRPGRLTGGLRHTCFCYLTCLDSAEYDAASEFAPLREQQRHAIELWCKREMPTPPVDDWPFGLLCALHRVLADDEFNNSHYMADRVLEWLTDALVQGAADQASIPSAFGPIFLSSVNAFSTLVDGRVLDGPKHAEVAGALVKLSTKVADHVYRHPRFAKRRKPSISAAMAGLTFFMWPWLDEVLTNNVAANSRGVHVKAVERLCTWIEQNWDDPSVYTDYWTEFVGSFLATDVLQMEFSAPQALDVANVTQECSSVLVRVRKDCVQVRPNKDEEYRPEVDPAIFAPV